MIRLGTLFSGIGAAEQAFIKLGIEHKLVFACDNGERELDISEEEIKEKIKDMNNIEKKEYIDQLYGNLKKPNYMYKSYMHNYKLDDENFYQDIRFLDGKNL